MPDEAELLHTSKDRLFVIYADHTGILCKYWSEGRCSWHDYAIDNLYDRIMRGSCLK